MYKDKKDPRISEYQKLYYEKNKDKYKERTKCNSWKNSLPRLYNITVDTWNSMFISQTGCCAICGIHQDKLSKKLCVDHNHTTGKVRALLCNSCNKNVGVFEIWEIKINKYLEVYDDNN